MASSSPISSRAGSITPPKYSAPIVSFSYIPIAAFGCCHARWRMPRCARWLPEKTSMKVTNSLLLVAFAAAQAESPHLANIRQLTFAGQNAEAYWSTGGNRIIYQSTLKPLDCDQIFIMNRDGSDPHMVSTGKGRCTCGYFLRHDRI